MKKVEKVFLEVAGEALGVFLDQQTTQKNYSEVVTNKKRSQNEISQRWIDSQYNSESFKPDFKLKLQKKSQNHNIYYDKRMSSINIKIGINGSPRGRFQH